MSGNKITVKGIDVRYDRMNSSEYISLTDIARLKNTENPADVINKWMSNKDSFDFYSLWEELFNADFNLAESREIRMNEVGYNVFTMSPSQWKKRTNAVGIMPGAGKYSKGTFAHPDIAMEFSGWIDTTFKLYLIREFRRLKENERAQLQWTVRRELTKLNYHVHTDAIKENLIVPSLTEKQRTFVYADEADVLNVALFGHTASQWRAANPDKKGNVRDHANIHQLLVLANMESYNAILIEGGRTQSERMVLLNGTARKQLETLLKTQIDRSKMPAPPKGPEGKG